MFGRDQKKNTYQVEMFSFSGTLGSNKKCARFETRETGLYKTNLRVVQYIYRLAAHLLNTNIKSLQNKALTSANFSVDFILP